MMILERVLISFTICCVVLGESTPTCPGGAPTCSPQTTPPVCSLWWDGQFVYSGNAKLKVGDTVGEPDVAIKWYNHDKLAWKVWQRFSHFFEAPEKDNLVCAPGYTNPLECHSSLGNLQVTNPSVHSVPVNSRNDHFTVGMVVDVNNAENQTIPLVANRAILLGDAVFTNCRHPDLSSKIKLQKLPEHEPGYFQKECICIDVIKPAPSTIPFAGMGAFAKNAFQKEQTISQVAAMHMRRSELHNKLSDEYEVLINYAFGHPQTQLLLLPAGPGVNYINHASNGFEANVKLVWPEEIVEMVEEFFDDDPSHILFLLSEKHVLYLHYEALRDIEPGEELFLDYGKEWEVARKKYVQGCGGMDNLATCKSVKPFRQVIGVPEGFFPQRWLDIEVDEVPSFSWDLPDLKPGEIRQLQVKESGAFPMSFGHRVGLPHDLSEKMREYADRIGISDIMRKYVTGGEPLKLGGTERHRINGGAWWAKRFDGEWSSNMHYITPDDEWSNTDFLSALGDAGFDQVLSAMGKYFGLDGLVCYYASFIAVSHCTGSHPHTDAEDTNGKGFNLIFPVLQANESTPELVLGEDGFGPLMIPYRYEPHAAVILGDEGVHQTAPVDYRGSGEMRMVVSVYIADINNDNKFEVWWDKDSDPPYPRLETRMSYLLTNAGRDWKAGTDNKLPKRDESYV